VGRRPGSPAALRARGALTRAVDVAAVEQAVAELLATVPGEREMRPAWGSWLRTRLFEPNDEVLAQLLRDDAAEAIARREPRVALRLARVELAARVVRLRAEFELRGVRPLVVDAAEVAFARE
jgi:phage baseplate assembly protein W